MKPRIGITTFIDNVKGNPYSSVNYTYINSVVQAGGLPVLIPVMDEKLDLSLYADNLDGVLFTGGEDIAPRFFNENPVYVLRDISIRRDEFEISLFHAAKKRNIPILGICRGIQLIDVALGGTLYQDIRTQVKDSFVHNPDGISVDELYHSVNIEKNTKLYNIFKENRMYVNSFHHQSVRDIPEGLKVSAYSEDGIVEAFESIGEEFLMGIQWHPECLVERHPQFIKLFEEFVNACSDNI